jgi:hypothetical protein
MNNNTPHAGTFPLHITKNDDQFVVITNQGNHYASTHDPSAARLIAAAPDLLSTLEFLLADYIAINGEKLTGSSIPSDKAREALRKAKGEA